MATVNSQSPPSTAAIAIATAIIAGLGGYYLGQATSLGIFAGSDQKAGYNKLSESEKGSDEEDEDEAQEPEEISSFPGSNEECKLVLVVRTDLGMTKGQTHGAISRGSMTDSFAGKIAAQCSHATLACYKTLLRHGPESPILRRWERLGQAKIALQVKSEDELELLQAQAVSLGLVAQVVHDAGRTQIASGSATVLGVGPAPKSKVDAVTGHLKLL
ncbi:MAG: hypothetical protein M1812_005013 [Candelaria pacifica]|nr:MAG: hypothetical protein M1812_005013 [Candelaria pacifica]